MAIIHIGSSQTQFQVKSLYPNATLCYVLGDLHGNALKLLVFALKVRVCELPTEDYQRYFMFYLNYNRSSPQTLDNEDLYSLKNIKKTEKQASLLILGDFLCDRGKSDYLSLYVFNALHSLGILVETVIGNHCLLGLLGFTLYKPHAARYSDPPINRVTNFDNIQKCSYAESLGIGLDEIAYHSQYCSRDDSLCLFPSPEAEPLSTPIMNNYNSFMKLYLEHAHLLKIAYDVRSRGIDTLLFTHTPFSIRLYVKLVAKLALISENPRSLKTDLNSESTKIVNDFFRQILTGLMTHNPNNDDILNRKKKKDICSILFPDGDSTQENNAISNFVWNREQKVEEKRVPHNQLPAEIKCNYHGHVGPEHSFSIVDDRGPEDSHYKYAENACNLDSYFGRAVHPEAKYPTNEKEIVNLNGPIWEPAECSKLVIIEFFKAKEETQRREAPPQVQQVLPKPASPTPVLERTTPVATPPPPAAKLPDQTKASLVHSKEKERKAPRVAPADADAKKAPPAPQSAQTVPAPSSALPGIIIKLEKIIRVIEIGIHVLNGEVSNERNSDRIKISKVDPRHKEALESFYTTYWERARNLPRTTRHQLVKISTTNLADSLTLWANESLQTARTFFDDPKMIDLLYDLKKYVKRANASQEKNLIFLEVLSKCFGVLDGVLKTARRNSEERAFSVTNVKGEIETKFSDFPERERGALIEKFRKNLLLMRL